MKMWIFRDEHSPFYRISLSEPHKVYDKFVKKYCWQAGMWDTMALKPSDFPEVTFENSPMEVELKPVNNVQGK